MTQPRGYFKYILAMDCETTGLAFNNDDPSYDKKTNSTYQAISWGFLVLDADTLAEVDRLYVEIKYDGTSIWQEGAEKVHGLSKEHLEKHGFTEQEAVVEIANLILNYWGPESPICAMGHNVQFDIWFFKRLMRKFDLEIKFANRCIDTNGVAFTTFQTYNSDDFFEAAGMPDRDQHNALEDICYTVESVRRVRKIFNRGLR